jgi:hypothetical protein
MQKSKGILSGNCACCWTKNPTAHAVRGSTVCSFAPPHPGFDLRLLHGTRTRYQPPDREVKALPSLARRGPALIGEPTTLPETAAEAAPQALAASVPFLIDRGSMYWSEQGGNGASAIWRCPLAAATPKQQLAVTKGRHVPIVLGGGRLYFVDDKSLSSVPMDGSGPVVEHFEGVNTDLDEPMVVDRGCRYRVTRTPLRGRGWARPVPAIRRPSSTRAAAAGAHRDRRQIPLLDR